MNGRHTSLSLPTLLVALILLLVSSLAQADSDLSPYENSLQFGFEYDDNVFKTFSAGENDLLMKVLLKLQRDVTTEQSRWEFGAQLGGKKYVTLPEQDTAIGQTTVVWRWDITDKSALQFSNDFKGQIENSQKDANLTDITEDFISESGRLQYSFPLSQKLRQQLVARVTYFNFFGSLPTDFTEENIGTNFTWTFDSIWSASAGYDFSLTQFPNSPSIDRHDRQQELSAGLNYFGPFLVSLGYAYIDDTSSEDSFSSSGHKISALFSWAFQEAYTLHILGTLQIRSYPSVSISDLEGQRLLFSDSEETNFNTLTVKLTRQLSSRWTTELKYSRYSNELSDREASFSRNLMMIGLRTDF